MEVVSLEWIDEVIVRSFMAAFSGREVPVNLYVNYGEEGRKRCEPRWQIRSDPHENWVDRRREGKESLLWVNYRRKGTKDMRHFPSSKTRRIVRTSSLPGNRFVPMTSLIQEHGFEQGTGSRAIAIWRSLSLADEQSVNFFSLLRKFGSKRCRHSCWLAR